MYNRIIIFITDCLFSDFKWYRRKIGGIWYKQYYRQEGSRFPLGFYYFWNRLNAEDMKPLYIMNVEAVEDYRAFVSSTNPERGQRPPVRKERRAGKSTISSI